MAPWYVSPTELVPMVFAEYAGTDESVPSAIPFRYRVAVPLLLTMAIWFQSFRRKLLEL